MKYVFVINSHTTFLTSMGTIDFLRLKVEDVVFIYVRNYCNKVTSVPFLVLEGTEIAGACKNITRDYCGYIRLVDEFVDRNVGERYNLYVPHLWHYFFQILYTNKKCKKVSYIQEGGPVQTKVYEIDVPVLERFKSFIRHTILGRRTFECKWYKTGILYKQNHLESYAINDVYFQRLPSINHIVKWPTQSLDFVVDNQKPIFVFDGHIGNGLVEPDIYMQLCRKIITLYSKDKNYVKFHPAQDKEERETILGYFDKNTIEILNDGIPLEYVIIRFEKLSFVGFTSSLLYYAHDYGHNVICCEKMLSQMSETYRKHVEANGFQSYQETYGE